jgi:hypothetical protein
MWMKSDRPGALGANGQRGDSRPIRTVPGACRPSAARHELFAVYVASGLSYGEPQGARASTRIIGFRPMRMPSVRARVEELVSEPAERIRAGIDAEFLTLCNRVANEDLDAKGRRTSNSRLKLIMAHARYCGWIVERKQVAQTRLNLGCVSVEDLEARTARDLDVLEAGLRADIERQVQDLRARRTRLSEGQLDGRDDLLHRAHRSCRADMPGNVLTAPQCVQMAEHDRSPPAPAPHAQHRRAARPESRPRTRYTRFRLGPFTWT